MGQPAERAESWRVRGAGRVSTASVVEAIIEGVHVWKGRPVHHGIWGIAPWRAGGRPRGLPRGLHGAIPYMCTAVHPLVSRAQGVRLQQSIFWRELRKHLQAQ